MCGRHSGVSSFAGVVVVDVMAVEFPCRSITRRCSLLPRATPMVSPFGRRARVTDFGGSGLCGWSGENSIHHESLIAELDRVRYVTTEPGREENLKPNDGSSGTYKWSDLVLSSRRTNHEVD